MRSLAALVLLVAACGSSSSASPPDASSPVTPVVADDAGADGSTPAPDAATPPSTCGVRAGMGGTTSRKLTAAGLDRTYQVYLPASLDPKKPVPLVFVHHGYTMSGAGMQKITGYTELADQKGFAVVFPDGQSGPNSTDAPWNVGDRVCPSSLGDVPIAKGDDFAFLDAMKADIAQDQCLDDRHVYLAGFSMGAYFAHHAGCMRSDIRAVAPHSGGTHDLAACPVARKPIIMFHGDADEVIPVGCDDPNAKNTPAGFTPSATAWAAHNGCANTVHTVAVEKGTCSYYDDCPADGQVAICVLQGMDHCWAGGTDDGFGDACPGWASATQLEWDFFQKYAN